MAFYVELTNLEKNKEWINFNSYQENAVKYEESVILRPSVCSPLQ